MKGGALMAPDRILRLPDVIERQLAHAERRAMMQAWADFLAEQAAGAEVIPFRRSS